MLLRELFKSSGNILRLNLILVQPLLIFMLILSFALPNLIKSGGITVPSGILFVALLLLFFAFIAGWGKMFKMAVQKFNDYKGKDIKPLEDGDTIDPENIPYDIDLFRFFTIGIGEFFMTVSFGFVLYAFLAFIVVQLSGILGESMIGLPTSFGTEDIKTALMSEEAANSFLASISAEDKTKLLQWNLLTLLLWSVFQYVSILLFPALMSGWKNPLKAYITGVKAVFNHPFIVAGIFVSFSFAITLIMLLGSIVGMNAIGQFLVLILFILTLVYFVLMLFLYFEKYGEKFEQTEIPAQITGDSGTDSNGQE